jgi:hypothetical protein
MVSQIIQIDCRRVVYLADIERNLMTEYFSIYFGAGVHETLVRDGLTAG